MSLYFKKKRKKHAMTNIDCMSINKLLFKRGVVTFVILIGKYCFMILDNINLIVVLNTHICLFSLKVVNVPAIFNKTILQQKNGKANYI